MSRLEASALLRRAVERSADAAGVTLTVRRSDSTRWASATFAGARHELTVLLEEGATATGWLDALPDLDLPMRGHLVADLKIVRTAPAADGREVVLEVLTVEDE